MAAPDDAADETLDRVARRLEQGGVTEGPPARYCYIVARFVFLEHLRGPERRETALTDAVASRHSAAARAEGAGEEAHVARHERLLECLDRCLAQLAQRERLLILEYYRGQQRTKIERRKALAASFGLTMNALSIRACRVRGKLEACVAACGARDDTFSANLLQERE